MEILIGSKVREEKKIDKILRYLIFLLSGVGLLITSLELYLSSQDRSICKSEACALVHSYDKYGTLNFIGVVLFSFLFILGTLEMFSRDLKSFSFLKRVRFLVVSMAVLVEGYLVGFQTWFIKEFCGFCLGVATIIFLIFFGEVFYQKLKLPSFLVLCGFVSLFISTSLVGVELKALSFDNPVIIYKEDCSHCKEVLNYARKNEIPIKTYHVKEAYFLMSLLKIREVPTLIYREDKSISVLVGKGTILEWFQENYKPMGFGSQKDKSQEVKILTSKETKPSNFKETPIKPNATTAKGRDKSEKTNAQDTSKEEKKSIFGEKQPEKPPIPIPSEEEACRIDKGC